MRKTVLITGSSKGIGRTAAELFAENNYNVIINYLNSEKDAHLLAARLEQQGHPVMVCKADISQRDQVEKMVEAGRREFGEIDVLVNNAGISQQRLFIDITEQEWNHMFNVHVNGMFNCCQYVVPIMINRRQGKIINISSIWGMTGASCEVHYSAAKAAVIGFTKALAKELGPSNIQVNCIAPGIIDTDMNRFLDEDARNQLIQDTPLMRFGTPAEVAYAILYLASDKANFLTGQVISPNGGFVI